MSRKSALFVAILLAPVVLTLTAPVAANDKSHCSASLAADIAPQVPLISTVSVMATINEITADGNVVVTTNEKRARILSIRVPEGVAIRAQKKRDFDGRRKLLFDDLQAGQRLRLTYLPRDDDHLLGLTVLKSKDA